MNTNKHFVILKKISSLSVAHNYSYCYTMICIFLLDDSKPRHRAVKVQFNSHFDKSRTGK